MNEAYNYQALPPGTMIQEYRIERVLAQGSFGIVYIGENQFLPETVAIKEFLPGELATRAEGTRVMPLRNDLEVTYQDVLHKFLGEARTLFELGKPRPHRNIVRVTRYHEENGTGYMVMDYEQGEPLSEKLGDAGTLAEAELSTILFPLLNGLEAVHAAQVTHRDIKPENILVRPDGSPVLIDFGAARRPRADGQKSRMAMFTPNYAAPEQFYDMGEQGPWTDIYALGATLYRAVTGHVPTNASERLRGKTYTPAAEVAVNNYTPTFLAAIDAALALQPQDRPQSVAEWRALFERRNLSDDSSDTVVIPVRRPEPPAPQATTRVLQSNLPLLQAGHHRLRRLFIWLSVLGLAAVGVVTLFIWWLPKEHTSFPSSALTPASTPEPAPETDIAALRTDVEGLIRQLGCARIVAEIGNNGRVLLSGQVSSRSDREDLRADVASLPGVREVSDDLEVNPDKFCQITGLLTAFQTLEPAGPDAVALETNKLNLDFTEGELLVVYVTASPAFSGYLYVDFIDSAGNVVHMLPSPIAFDHVVQAGQRVILGDQPCPECYEISPPHGRNMMVAISSSAPLLDKMRPEVESLNEYLPKLRAGLERLSAEDGDIISTFQYITTHK